MNVEIAPPIELEVHLRRLPADMTTPVTLYLNLRDQFTDPVLLESNDSNSSENYWSYLGFETLASFQVRAGLMQLRYPGEPLREQPVQDTNEVPDRLYQFIQRFQLQRHSDSDYQGFNGVFGHTGFDAVQYFDTLQFNAEQRRFDIPDLRYHVYRYIIAVNHFKNQLFLIENLPKGEASQLDHLEQLILSRKFVAHPFERQGAVRSNLTDEAYRALVRAGKHHCQIGDVFQIVLSRQFEQDFRGDDFQVYRALRSINPSPYLFYFDYGDYRIFGSSPEAQLIVEGGTARVNPIAGTYRRTGDRQQDAIKAEELLKDPKENAEHVMLVDLARNDLGRHTTNVRVTSLKEVQYFSHVIHLVSTVEGDLDDQANPIRIFGDTFPAGTLSGAPKYKAMELIDQYENQHRSFYGGALGVIDFAGNMNQAIVIRSFLSMDNTLYSQAGAGIVSASQEELELQEVNNKLGALNRALDEAEKL